MTLSPKCFSPQDFSTKVFVGQSSLFNALRMSLSSKMWLYPALRMCGTGSSLVIQQVKDPACCSLLQRRFDPWPGKFRMPKGVAKKKRKKKRKRMCSTESKSRTSKYSLILLECEAEGLTSTGKNDRGPVVHTEVLCFLVSTLGSCHAIQCHCNCHILQGHIH